MKFKRYFKRLLSVIILLNTTVLFAQDLTNGLISVWEFDETNGDIASDSYGNNNGNLNNGTIPNKAGKIGTAYLFDGTSGSVNIPRSIRPISNFTLSLWIKPIDWENNEYPGIFGGEGLGRNTAKGGIAISYYRPTDRIYFDIYSSSLRKTVILENVSSVIPSGGWYNIVFKYDGLKIYAYHDNQKIGEAETGNISIDWSNAGYTLIGCHYQGGLKHFSGLIDQVVLWDRALTEDEVSQLYNSGNGLPYTEWSGTAQLSGGTISPDTLTIDYNESPGIISSTASASGGSESYTYQWQSSTDSGNNWSDISAATSISYTPQALIQTTWFRRRVTDDTDTTYSNNSEITVTIPGGGGTITSVALASDDFTVTGSPITSSGTITVNLANASVDAAHLSNNIISGRTALTSGLSSTDELFVSDVSEAKLKRMDVSVLQNYLQSNLDFGSGSGTSLWSTSTTNNSNIVRESGNVGIGVSDPGDYKLAVNGTIRSKEVIVETANWADYVFEPDYKLKSLDEIEQFIKENGHLPDIPSATQVQKNGVGLAEMNILLLKKVEELTLYIIDQQKEINSLKSDLTEIRNEN